MSEHWSLSNRPEEPKAPEEATTAPDGTPTTPDGVTASGPAIPLGPAGGEPRLPTGTPGTTPVRPPAYGGPTPPAGVWMPPTPPTPGWGQAAPATPYPATPYPGGPYPGTYPAGAGGTLPPPPPGWPTAGFSTPGPQPVPVAKRSNAGLLAGLAAAVAVVVLLAGAGLGHVLWTSGTSTSASAPSGGSSGSSGGTGSPFGGGSSSSPFGSGSSGGSSSGSSSSGVGAPSDISAIAAKVDPGLVDINTNLSYEGEAAAGTGMVLTSNGEILTNNHVIDGATSISVTDIGNGKTYSATVVGYDRTGDVAVIKLTNASGLQTVSTSTGVATVGESVVGIGNAGGAGGTPSTAGGSVTSTNQSITASDDSGGNAENLTGLIETNADIQPGDSGGSLVDTSGQVIGMDTAASSTNDEESTTAQAYAIPIGTALSLANKIEAGDASSTIHIGGTGFLGVAVSDSSATGGSGGSGSGGFGFGSGSTGSGSSGTGSSTAGADVQSVVPNDPGANAGIAEGDVITGLGGKTISSSDDLTNDLNSYHPGDKVQITWTDTSGQSQSATVTLASGPPA